MLAIALARQYKIIRINSYRKVDSFALRTNLLISPTIPCVLR
nr:hypothetical protein [Fusarium oxysporum]